MIDLDELLERVRDPLAKEQLQEATNCYRAGAYRAAIVATWVAVMFDFVAKLRELDMTGNQAARTRLTSLEAIRTNHDLPQLLAFEKEMIREATIAFELISPVEAVDLDRLYEDRNRCAHPSLTALDDIFRPSAELARTHLVASVTNMLGQAPLQGTAAAKRIFADIGSEFFPTDPQAAAEYLRHGPINRAKPTLIRSVIIGVTKDLLNESRSTIERKRQLAALNALEAINPELFKRALKDNLARIVEGVVGEESISKIILYAGQVPGTWELLGPANQLRCVNFMANASARSVDVALVRALEIPALRMKAISRISEFGISALGRMLQARPEPLFKERCIFFFERSTGFREAETNLRSLVLPYATILSLDDLTRIAAAFVNNRQIRFAADVPSLLLELFQGSPNTSEYRTPWEGVHQALCTDRDEFDLSKELIDALQQHFGFVSCPVSAEQGIENASA